MGDVIQSFLVSLGFGVDDSSLQKFNKAISSAAIRVSALYVSVQAAAAGIFFGIAKIADSFEKLGYEMRLIAPAINQTLMLRKVLLSTYKAAGIDMRQAAQQAVLFNLSLTKTKYALDAIYKSAGVKFLPLLTQQMDIFRSKLFANMPKIVATLERFVKFIFKAFEATVTLGQRAWSMLSRLFEMFSALDEATGGWASKILIFIGVWKMLNASILASPLGILLAGLIALLALYDDFKTAQEGGQSLFDWSTFIPLTKALGEALDQVWKIITGVFKIIQEVVLAFKALFSLNFSAFADGMDNALKKVFETLWEIAKLVPKVAGIIGGVFGAASNIFSGGNILSKEGAGLFNGQAAPLGVDQAKRSAPPVQNVSQETNINMTGLADPGAAGKVVVGAQNQVNFDMVRNMRGATR